jgi:hypothetical protein
MGAPRGELKRIRGNRSLKKAPSSVSSMVSRLTGARTFGVQARHIAFCLNEVAIALLGEQMLPHTDQEGPRNLTSKEDIVKYLRDAFTHAHRAIGTLTNENLLEQIADPYAEKLRTTRLDAAGIFLSHTWDHYGQIVEYLRMNNLVPPGHQ